MPDMDTGAVYRIRVGGILGTSWSHRPGGMRISMEPPQTVTLVGRLADQAALAGVLDALYGLHLPAMEVKRLTDKRS